MTVVLFNGSPPPPTQPIPPLAPSTQTAVIRHPLAVSISRGYLRDVRRGLVWILHNWAIRTLVYLTVMSAMYLAVYFLRPDLMPEGLTMYRIEIYCYEYRYDLRQQPFTMACF